MREKSVATKRLSKQALNKCYINWAFFHLCSLGYERMEAFGFLHSMLPVIKELYHDNSEEEIKALKRHSMFFNVEPVLGTVIPGIIAGLEENKANGAEIDDEMINSVKAGLMGPLSGIGDSFFQGLLTPILLSIGITLAKDGNVFGPIFYIVSAFSFIVLFSRFVFKKGYQLGIDAVNMFFGENAQRIERAFRTLGLIVTGAIAASFINLEVSLSITEDGTVGIQSFLDTIFPKVLPLSLLVLTWYLSSKKRMKPTTIIIAFVIVALAGGFVGIL